MGASARHGLQLGLRPSQAGKAPGFLTGDESPQSFMDHCRLLLEPREALGLFEEGVIQIQCGSHVHIYMPI
jgi:hypothetical protein